MDAKAQDGAQRAKDAARRDARDAYHARFKQHMKVVAALIAAHTAAGTDGGIPRADDARVPIEAGHLRTLVEEIHRLTAREHS